MQLIGSRARTIDETPLDITGATLIIVSVTGDGGCSVSDSALNVYQNIYTGQNIGGITCNSLWYCINPITQTNFTFGPSFGGVFIGWAAAIFSGTGALDQLAVATGAGGSASAAPITPTSTGLVIFGAGEDNGSLGTLTPGTMSQVHVDSQGCCYGAGVGWQIGVSAQIDPSWTIGGGVGWACGVASFLPIVTPPLTKSAGWQGTDRILARLHFHHKDASGADKTYHWSGHVVPDATDSIEARVLSIGYNERKLSGFLADIFLASYRVELSDRDFLLRGFLGDVEQEALINVEVQAEWLTEAHWRAAYPWKPLFRGVVRRYRPGAGLTFGLEMQSKLGRRMQQPFPLIKYDTTLFPNLPDGAKEKYAPVLMGSLSNEGSATGAPTLLDEASKGSFFDDGGYKTGFGNITNCLASPPSGLAAVAAAGGTLSIDVWDAKYGVTAWSVDVNGVEGDQVPFFTDQPGGGSRGTFHSGVPTVTVDGTQKINCSWTVGASAAKTRVALSYYYFGARFTQIIEVVAPGNTCSFTHQRGVVADQTPLEQADITLGASLVTYDARRRYVVVGNMSDGETAPSMIADSVGSPYRRPLRFAWNDLTGEVNYGIYYTSAVGPVVPITSWNKRWETTSTFFIDDMLWTGASTVTGLATGTGLMSPDYVGLMDSVNFPPTQFYAFCICYGVGKEIKGVYLNGVKVTDHFNTTWAVPGFGTAYSTHFGPNTYRTIGNFRFFMLYVQGPDGEAIANGTSTLHLNVVGYEEAGDGSGAAISSGYAQLKFLLEQFVLPDTPHTKVGGNWLASPSWNDGTLRVKSASFTSTETEAAAAITGSVDRAFMIRTPDQVGTIIKNILQGLDSAYFESMDGESAIALLPPAPLSAISAETIDHVNDILDNEFDAIDDEQQWFNAIPYEYNYDYGSGLFLRNGIAEDAAYQTKYGNERVESPIFSLQTVQLQVTAAAIAHRARLRHRKPPRTLNVGRALPGIELELGTRYRLTHPEGLTATGFTNRFCQLAGVAVGIVEHHVAQQSWDLDWIGADELADWQAEEAMAEYYLGGRLTESPPLTAAASQTDQKIIDGFASRFPWAILLSTAGAKAIVRLFVLDAALSVTPKIKNVTDSTIAVTGTPTSSLTLVTQELTIPNPGTKIDKDYELLFDITGCDLVTEDKRFVAIDGRIRSTHP